MNKDEVAEMSQQYQVEAAKKLVPEGYKQTEVGIIPEDWEVSTIQDLKFELSDGNYSSKYPRSDEFKSIGVPFIRANNIKSLTVIDADMRFISEEKHQEITKGHLKKGDVLITNRGEIGNLAIVPDRHIGSNINAQIVRLNTSGTEVLNAYFAYFLQKDEVRAKLQDLQTGSALKQLPVNRLKTLQVVFPKKREQAVIANALSDTDALLSELEKFIAKKQAIKTATMQQLLTGRTRLPQFANYPDGSKKGYKQSELGEIPEDWEVVELSAVVEKIVGGGTPSRSNPAYWGNEIPWVTVKDFATFSPFTAQEKITKLGLQNSSSNLIPSGTLITSTRMALGKAVIYKVDVAINQDLKAIFANRKLETNFLYFWFENNAQKIEELGSGSTVKGLSLTDLRKIPFLLQSMEEQTAIATILSDMDEEIQTLEQRLNKTRQIKQGMMQELLTGKTRLIVGGKNV